MFEFLANWFPAGGEALRVEGFWLSRPVKLPHPITTPLRSRVTLVRPCIDVDYRVTDGQIIVGSVRMARDGGAIMGSNVRINITAERTGEAFYVGALSPHSLLTDYVREDLQDVRGPLRRKMFGKWRHECPAEVAPALIDALNDQGSVEQIRQLIGNVGVRGAVEFTYNSPKRGAEERVVTVHSVQGAAIQATDHKDGMTKTFRMDRISNVRPAPPGA
jgi:hypothetical protein